MKNKNKTPYSVNSNNNGTISNILSTNHTDNITVLNSNNNLFNIRNNTTHNSNKNR